MQVARVECLELGFLRDWKRFSFSLMKLMFLVMWNVGIETMIMRTMMMALHWVGMLRNKNVVSILTRILHPVRLACNLAARLEAHRLMTVENEKFKTNWFGRRAVVVVPSQDMDHQKQRMMNHLDKENNYINLWRAYQELSRLNMQLELLIFSAYTKPCKDLKFSRKTL